MEAILIQHGCAEALKGDERMSESLSSKEKLEMIDRAREVQSFYALEIKL